MFLQHLKLINFKNYQELTVRDFGQVNVLVGKNGSGKTNFLDAIHFLSMTRSAVSSVDTNCIRKSEKFFSIKGDFTEKKSVNEIMVSFQIGSKKVVREGINEYKKLSDHIGKYPVVMIEPDDVEMIKEGSEERRKFFDSIIAQIDQAYLDALIRYSGALKQRNSLLKMFADSGKVDELALESYDMVLAETATIIFNRRVDFASQFLPFFQKYYRLIIEDEPVNVIYNSELSDTKMHDGLKRNRQRDLLTQRTNFGIHRDDFNFLLGDSDLKKFGSQGQKKSFVIALKLAQFEMITAIKQSKPILLLDDIFDKLDDHRISRLLSLIKSGELGQLFITDARPDRTSELLKEINVEARVYHIENGVILSS